MPGATPVRVDWRRAVPDIDALAPEWTELETAVRGRTVFSTFDYLVTWYRRSVRCADISTDRAATPWRPAQRLRIE